MDQPSERIEKIKPLLKQGLNYSVQNNCINTLTEANADCSHRTSIEATSSHNYPAELIELINQNNDGWILDCGSGSRIRSHSNLINFEIAPFPGVDVIGVAEDLPFKCQSFSLVISLSVLEHVSDPFKAATEMQRVLKPGGKIWIDTAFMQPFHAYPSHYYNMTYEGLKNLLSSDLQIIRDTVPRYGTPIWSLSWIVSHYSNSLPENAREEFLQLSIKDLLQSPEVLCEKPFATELPESARKELAATVSIIARKKFEKQ